jgi:hypothetical protein
MTRYTLLTALLATTALAQSGPQITIYHDGFATVKTERRLELDAGVTETRVTNMSRQLEPDSVIVREVGPAPLGMHVLEQSFVNDPLTEGLMLHQFEGRSLRFEEQREDGSLKEHRGTVIRSGYVPGRGQSEEPIIQTSDGVRFALPGRPVFDGLDADAFLKPSLVWLVGSERAGETDIEISYITGGMSWEATYSLVAPTEDSDQFDFSGWISLQNNTGIGFENAGLKLIAGDVAKVQPVIQRRAMMAEVAYAPAAMPEQRAFDEFHLYTLPRPVELRNNELKQVEFIRAEGVKGRRTYTYNPLIHTGRGRAVITDADYGRQADTRVGVRIEIENSETNQLGMPLPQGRLRLYRTDETDGRREFVGENEIDRVPRNETLKLDMGYAFDLVGERRQTDFQIDTTGKRMRETIAISLRNRKQTQPVEIRVIEPLARSANAKIAQANQPYEQIDARTIEFTVPVAADSETNLTYTVHYSW